MGKKSRKKGKSVESLRRSEQEVGRRVRLAGGKEIIVMGNPFDEDLSGIASSSRCSDRITLPGISGIGILTGLQ